MYLQKDERDKMENTNCYKCEKEITAEIAQVHPLCDECNDDFDAWFQEQLMAFKK